MRAKPVRRPPGRRPGKKPLASGVHYKGAKKSSRVFGSDAADGQLGKNHTEIALSRSGGLAPTLVKTLEQMPALKWYSVVEETAGSSSSQATLTFPSIETAKTAGERLALAVADYVAAEEGKGKTPWLQHLTKKGTMTDRVSALVLMVQQIPVARLEPLRQLLHMAAKLAARREATLALNALKDVIVEDLLPPDRKLQFFHQNNSLQAKGAGTIQVTSWQLLTAWFEDALKSLVAAFIVILHRGLRDTVPFVRHTCLRCAFELLVACPEQEGATLGLLSEQLCGVWPEDGLLAVRHLKRLLESHPQMQPVVVTHVVEEVWKHLTFAPPKTLKKSTEDKEKKTRQRDVITRAVVFLSEIKHTKKHNDVTRLSVELFAGVLHSAVGELKEGGVAKKVNKLKREKRKALAKGRRVSAALYMSSLEKLSCSSLMRAVMTGLTRAIPFLDAGASLPPSLSADWDMLDKLLAEDSLSVARMGGSAKIALYVMLSRLGQLLGKDTAGLLSSLYSDIRDCSLLHASNRNVLLNLLRDLLENDSTDRLLSFKRRLLQVAANVANPAVQLGILAQLSEIMASDRVGRVLVEKSDAELQRAEIPVEELREAGCTSGADAVVSPSESILRRYGYKEKGGDPRFARPDMSSLWELHLYRTSVVPNVAEMAPEVETGAAVSSPADTEDLSDAAILSLVISDESAEMFDDPDKREVQPHERFLAQHYRDAWVRKKAAEKKKLRQKGSSEAEDGGAEEGEDEEMDAFLDGVLSKELGTAGDVSEDDELDDEIEEEERLDSDVDNDETDELADEENEESEESESENDDGVAARKKLKSALETSGKFMDADEFFALQEKRIGGKKGSRVS